MIILDGVMVPLDKHSVSSRNHKTSKMGMTWSQLKRLACAPTSHFLLIVLMIYPFWISLNHFFKSVCVCSVAQLFQHFCDPTDCSLPGSSLHGIILARILERVAISSSRGSSQSRDWTQVSHNAGTLYQLSYQESPNFILVKLFQTNRDWVYHFRHNLEKKFEKITKDKGN